MTHAERVAIKSASKESISGNIWLAFGVAIVWNLILNVANMTVIGGLILAAPMSLGISLFYMQVSRTGKGEFETSFEGFNRFGVALGTTLLATLYIMLWSCLFVIPGIIACYRYSMVYYIIADNPDIKVSEAITKSKGMMKGHKWELFVLQLSFFWWYVLCGITFGIASIYVIPYIKTAEVKFYERIKDQPAISE